MNVRNARPNDDRAFFVQDRPRPGYLRPTIVVTAAMLLLWTPDPRIPRRPV